MSFSNRGRGGRGGRGRSGFDRSSERGNRGIACWKESDLTPFVEGNSIKFSGADINYLYTTAIYFWSEFRTKYERNKEVQKKEQESEERRAPRSDLDDQTLGYYRRVAETLDEFEGNEEEKDLFLSNVFNQMESEAGKVAKDQTVSHIVEKLVNSCSEGHVVSFMGALAEHWTDLCTSKFGSHILQTLCENIFKMLCDKKKNVEKKTRKNLLSSFAALCRVLLENFDEFVKNMYASHIVRVAIEVSGGVKVDDKVLRSRFSRDQRKQNQAPTKDVPLSTFYQPPAELLEIFDAFKDKILEREDINDLVYSQISGPVLQTLLMVTEKQNPKLCKKCCKKLIKKHDIFAKTKKEQLAPGYEIEISCVVSHETSSHLVDLLIHLVPADVFNELFTSHFKGKMLNYCLHHVGNFVIQKILARVDQEQFEEIFEEMKSHVEDLLATNREGVLVKLAEAAVRLGTKQEKFLKTLMKAFHCYKPLERQSKCVHLIASLSTYEIFYKLPQSDEEGSDKEEKKETPKGAPVPLLTEINYHGAMLLQQLVQFGNPKLLVLSFVDLKPVEVRNMAVDPKGNHVIEALLKSTTIGEKTKDVVYNKLKGWYADLACDRSGSRTVDALWSHATIKQKTIMAEDLSKHEARLTGDKFGRFVHRNCGLHHYMYRRKDWQEMQTGEIKKRKLFKDIIGDDAAPKPKKKKNVKEEDSEEEESSLLMKDEDFEKPTPMFEKASGSVSSGPKDKERTKKKKKSKKRE